jgi:elongator complex protein 3
MINRYIINQIIKKASIGKQGLSLERLSKIKRRGSRKYNRPCPTNVELLETYRKIAEERKIKIDKNIENILITKSIRTMSGVAIVAVLTKPYPCPGICVYCPDEKNMPKSYLSNEPAVMRAILTDFHPYKQAQARIKSLQATGHKTDKIELIVMGGTFSYLPKQYQTWFIKECFRACNKTSSKLKIKNLKLEKLQEINEKSAHRIVGLTLETRPDYIDKKEITRMRKLGATRVELGVQSIYDDVLKLNNRGHGRKEIIKATKLLKEAGFKINYHMMPNLPGSSYKRDLEMFKELFSNPDFQPDMLKIYPCVVIKNAQIYKWLKDGRYKPYSDKKLIELLSEIKKTVPYYIRITRLIRDIPSTSIIAGNKVSNLRQILKKKSEEEGWQCKCIRCREVRNQNPLLLKEGQGVVVKKLKLFRQDYDASDGKEIFLSFENEKRQYLYSLLRLRINKINRHSVSYRTPSVLNVLNNTAIIREVHTYGKLVQIKSKSKKSPQHTGLGKKLIAEAEKIAQEEFGLKKIAVISGVGVRDYYRKLGYGLEDEYMIKYI